jgi:dihydrofolate reductase
MRKIIAQEWMSLDGVVQAPSSPDEDTSGGFTQGGWHLPYFDETAMKWVISSINEAGGFLLGRRTYDLFAAHWPDAGEQEQPLAQPLNAKPKYVASTTLAQPLAWHNSSLIEGDIAAAVTTLKRQPGADLYLIGSTQLLQVLANHNLVDEYQLMIDPIILGSGKRAFPDGGIAQPMQLTSSQVTTTGAMIAIYTRAA